MSGTAKKKSKTKTKSGKGLDYFTVYDPGGEVQQLIADTIEDIKPRETNRTQLCREAIIKHCHELQAQCEA